LQMSFLAAIHFCIGVVLYFFLLQRWIILAQDAYLLTFKDENDLQNPTEVIDLRVCALQVHISASSSFSAHSTLFLHRFLALLCQVFNSVKSSGDYTNRPYSFDVYSPDLSFSFCASSDPEKEGVVTAPILNSAYLSMSIYKCCEHSHHPQFRQPHDFDQWKRFSIPNYRFIFCCVFGVLFFVVSILFLLCWFL